MIRREDALAYHAGVRPGKIEVRPTTPCLTPRELRLAYLPGAAFPAAEIAADAAAAFRYTARGNLVAVITNGTAVPGLGAVGPAAAKPMQEGMAVLLKRLADIDVFDLELASSDPGVLADAIALLEPTFGAINLKDVRAPEGLILHDLLVTRLGIPVLHENLAGTAVVAAAALRNALELVDKSLAGVRVVLCGAGTVGVGCARVLLDLGLPREGLSVYDARGLLHPDREDLHDFQRPLARADAPATLAEALRGADVFVGASAAGVLSQEMIRAMGRLPIVLALATPRPEIEYESALASRRDVIVATALDEHPNGVVDVLSVPPLLRGALDVQATRITPGMLLAASRALAELAREEVPEDVERAYGGARLSFGPDYLLPKPIDARVLVRAASAVGAQAVEDGVARRPLEAEAHREELRLRLGTGREILRDLMLRARQDRLRVVITEGASERILRACRILMDEGIAEPVLLGGEAEIGAVADRLRMDLGGVTIVDPERSPRLGEYVQEYFRMRRRRGVLLAAAEERVRQRDTFAAMMLHAGEADVMIAGLTTHYVESLRTILQVVGPAEGVRRVSSHSLALLPRRALVLADCAVNVDPGAEELAEIALLAAGSARSLGLEPRVALLSFSSFGSVDHPSTIKVRRAAEIVRERAPGLACDGEMQLSVALDGSFRRQHFPWTRLDGDANVLVFPDLQSGTLALQLLQSVGDAVVVGPVLMGTRRPVHLLQYGFTVEEVTNLITAAVVEAAAGPRAHPAA